MKVEGGGRNGWKKRRGIDCNRHDIQMLFKTKQTYTKITGRPTDMNRHTDAMTNGHRHETELVTGFICPVSHTDSQASRWHNGRQKDGQTNGQA